MSELKINPNRKYLREDKMPHFFCSGCGCGQVLNCFTQALTNTNKDSKDMLCIGGVGCTARIPVVLKADTFHGVHGRTLAWATGVKLHKPEIPIVIFAGDGDLASIGGNHFIHAARRNLDVTVVMVNNMNFAMTGGQVAPTTPEESRTMTTPYGSPEPRFDVCKLAMAAGATHVERWTTSKGPQVVKAMETALDHKGFSLIEVVSQCPTHFGRYALRDGNPMALVNWIDEHTYTGEEDAAKEAEGMLRLGKFLCIEKPTYEGTSEIF